ncbi:MAG: class I SAM-dependent rRNA methyltransferase [Bacteroidetes bacterium]|nr:MAG: class I SAM-dependent rRNA methyltransferase [Bacteroidota bacterium]
MNNYSKIILKSGKEQSINRYHPWIFSGAIKLIKGNLKEGDIVEVVSNHNEFLALGHYQIGTIAVRIFSFEKAEINADFWENKIQNAYNLRKKIGFIDNKETNVFRLVHGEGDGMPGAIIDFYNGTAVTQFHSIGMYLERQTFAKALKNIFSDKLNAVYDKSETTIPFKSEINATNEYLLGKNNTNIVSEYGNKFRVDWKEGQKTGFFIDQRENRKLLEYYSKDKTVLNVFGYTGGFSVYAMKGGAKLVHSVDSSNKAIELTDENIALNFTDTSRHKSFAVDAFSYLKDIKDKYDLIILDPPAFAKHNKALNNALKGYKKINTRAFEQIRPGGILFTFSCSQAVSKKHFREAVFSAAAISGRKVKILHQLTQPADHPVNIYHPEGEYLKGLVLYVE